MFGISAHCDTGLIHAANHNTLLWTFEDWAAWSELLTYPHSIATHFACVGDADATQPARLSLD